MAYNRSLICAALHAACHQHDPVLLHCQALDCAVAAQAMLAVVMMTELVAALASEALLRVKVDLVGEKSLVELQQHEKTCRDPVQNRVCLGNISCLESECM